MRFCTTVTALSLVASLSAADPFDAAAFEDGWKQVSRTPATGIAGDGQRNAIAWGPAGAWSTRDGGLTWTAPVLPSSGPVGGPGSAPVAVADAVILAGGGYIRSVDGAVRGLDGSPRNQTWRIGAVTAMVADGRGLLYAETAAGVDAIQGDRVVAHAAGRLVGAVGDGAVVVSGRDVVRLDAAGAHRLETAAGPGPDGHQVVPHRAPPTAGILVLAGGSWRVDGGRLVALGLHPQVTFTSFAGGQFRSGGEAMRGICVGTEAAGTAVLVGVLEGGGLRPLRIETPAGSVDVVPTSIGGDSARFRLLAATSLGVWMYRSGL